MTTKPYLDDLDALNTVRKILADNNLASRLAPSAAGWVLYAGEGERHAVSFRASEFHIHDGPTGFVWAVDVAESIIGFEADAAEEPELQVALTAGEAAFTVRALRAFAATQRGLAAELGTMVVANRRSKRTAHEMQALAAEEVATRIERTEPA